MIKLARSLPELYLPLIKFDYSEDLYEITQPINIYREFKKDTLVIGIPGAFIPSVQWKFLPEYKRNFYEIKALCNISQIAIVSSNDPHVLRTFAEEIDAEEKFVYICDFNSELAKGLGTEFEAPDLGIRSKPFRCVVKNGEISNWICDEEWKPTNMTRVHRLLRDFTPYYTPYPYSVYPDK